jgi:diguanylate cyclase (GGDEF)-like protein/putative nucleotidyltransferase with HDIG domain
MHRETDRGIIDQSALRMRVATIATGIWLTYVICGTDTVYVALTWHGPHRLVISALFGSAVLASAIISRLPREKIVRSRYREPFFFSWTMLNVALITLSAFEDGGTGSPLALTFFLPVVFASMSYPMASVIGTGTASVAAYLLLAVTVGGAGWAHQALFAVFLACTAAMSAWQARNHDNQRTALMEVSRADPLTGCLNRRGFEERAIAQMSAANRRAGEGAVLVLDIDHFKPVNDRYGHATGDELLRWVVHTIQQTVRTTDAIGRMGGDEFAVLLTDVDAAGAVESAARVTRALSERAPCSSGLASFPADGTELEDLMRLADVRLYASRRGRPDRDISGPTERLSWAATLAHAVDMRMNAAHEHSRSVAECAVSIATEMGWEPEMLGMLRMAAMLHDIGKVTVADEILCKPGSLTEEEFEAMKGHAVAGAELVSRIEGLDTIVPWIRHSHESFDGSGYPDGLRGEAIPQAARIMLVADAFDAITSSRPYREALSVAHACDELKRNAGSQFDPACVQALLECLDAGSLPGPGAVALALA